MQSVDQYFNSTSADVTSKINSLSAQLSREREKEFKTKNSQGTHEECVSKWMFCYQLQFVMPSTKCKDSFCSTKNHMDNSVLEFEPHPRKTTLKKSITERKVKLLPKCILWRKQLRRNLLKYLIWLGRRVWNRNAISQWTNKLQY